MAQAMLRGQAVCVAGSGGNGTAIIHSADVYRIPTVCQAVLGAKDTAMNKKEIPAFLKLKL